MSQITSTNRMSAKQLVISQGAALQFINNPNNGNLFFMCGNIKGYVSPAVKAVADSVSLDELQYAECSIDGAPAVPCLMMVGNSQQNVKRTLGADLL